MRYNVHMNTRPQAILITGSRNLGPLGADDVAALVRAATARGSAILTGCAAGADAAARAAAQASGADLTVYSVDSGTWGTGPNAYAARSAALARHAAEIGAAVVAFPLTPCPPAIRPARRWLPARAGTWSTAALAAGLGCPLWVWPAVLQLTGWPSWPAGSWCTCPPAGLDLPNWPHWLPAPAPAQQLPLL